MLFNLIMLNNIVKKKIELEYIYFVCYQIRERGLSQC